MMLTIGKANRDSKAFTLIEIILVVVILAIVLAIAVPSFTGKFKGLHLQQTVDDLRTCSRWAQAMAVGEHRIYAVAFDKERKSYSILRSAEDETSVTGEFGPVPSSLGRRRMIPEDVQLKVQSDRLHFYPDGTIDPGTIEVLSGEKRITLTSTLIRGSLIVNDQ